MTDPTRTPPTTSAIKAPPPEQGSPDARRPRRSRFIAEPEDIEFATVANVDEIEAAIEAELQRGDGYDSHSAEEAGRGGPSKPKSGTDAA